MSWNSSTSTQNASREEVWNSAVMSVLIGIKMGPHVVLKTRQCDKENNDFIDSDRLKHKPSLSFKVTQSERKRHRKLMRSFQRTVFRFSWLWRPPSAVRLLLNISWYLFLMFIFFEYPQIVHFFNMLMSLARRVYFKLTWLNFLKMKFLVKHVRFCPRRPFFIRNNA